MKWVLIDDRYARFNLWEAQLENGEHYKQCFWNGIDPNLKRKYDTMEYPENHVWLRKMHNEGMSVKEISEKLGMEYYSVKNFLEKKIKEEA